MMIRSFPWDATLIKPWPLATGPDIEDVMDMNEHANEQLRKDCRERWNKINENQRQLCLNQLMANIPIEVIKLWKKKGYWHARFHFAGGMQVRNLLRSVMPDDQLPGVPYQGQDELVKNWDDFYTGAIDELLEKTP